MTTNVGDGGSGGSGSAGSKARCMTSYVEEGTSECYRYYLSRKTTLEMLCDRGYDVADSELTRSFAEFRSTFDGRTDLERLNICVPLRSNPGRKIMVIFMGADDINVAKIRKVHFQLRNKESLKGLILIIESKMNSYAQKELEKFPFKVEVFGITDLLVNVTKHFLMPKHEILSAEEKQKLIRKHRLEEKHLPQLLQTDAIARYYGLEKGQVLKVTYSKAIAGGMVTYRCVV